jgi:Nif-specific regulatory protein
MKEQFCEIDLGECRTDLLPLLYEMSHIATASGDLSHILKVLLRLMQRHLKVVRGTVNLCQPGSGKIIIHESFGLSEEEVARGCYDPGEGITGRVVVSGKAVLVPRISQEPAFLNRTASRNDAEDGEMSFLCVPIVRGGNVLGAISAERHYADTRLLKMDATILAILAATTAQAVELYQLEHVHQVSLENENRRLHQALKARFQPSNLIGSSRPMQEVYGLIEKVAPAKTTVLILGESGVGKERVAAAIHYHSPRCDGPFIKFNCAALPETIIESELFGHEKGSFSGAVLQRQGRFEAADGGTLFLDEVGELSLAVQAKLLRVIQDRTFERVGGNIPVRVDLRILAATNRDLSAMVEAGTFREDLYYRLNVFPITIPPLRERGGDLIALADHFVTRFATEMGIEIHEITPTAMNMLLCYHWPGNVRELENIIERAMILAEEGLIHETHLPPSLQAPVVSELDVSGTLETRLATAEYEAIVEALTQYKGNTTDAAAYLGLTRRILGLRMNKYNLSYKDYRGG